MSVSSGKIDTYTTRYENMSKQLNDVNAKITRIDESLHTLEERVIAKKAELKEKHNAKIAYYNKCIQESNDKYKKDIADLKEKFTRKEETWVKELVKTKDYKKVVESNIKNLVESAKRHDIDLE